jgi:2-polyprenyl-6-methoxyphenol hydroxylase-like FAD-dependent oxidoreductase
MTATNRAIIVGAGIAGLAGALRLHQAGWKTAVVERAPTRRDGGYAVTFSGIGYDAAERMGILPALRQRHITPDQLNYIKPNGRLRFSVSGPTVRAMMGERALNLLRGDIEDVLYQEVRDHADIRFGTTIEAIQQGTEQNSEQVKATLSDGSVESADLLIGADGLPSRSVGVAARVQSCAGAMGWLERMMSSGSTWALTWRSRRYVSGGKKAAESFWSSVQFR